MNHEMTWSIGLKQRLMGSGVDWELGREGQESGSWMKVVLKGQCTWRRRKMYDTNEDRTGRKQVGGVEDGERAGGEGVSDVKKEKEEEEAEGKVEEEYQLK